jgi:hypothetical protein
MTRDYEGDVNGVVSNEWSDRPHRVIEAGRTDSNSEKLVTDGGDSDGEIEHDTPECPSCGSRKTRPLDDQVAVCFNCDTEWSGDFSELRQ